MTSAERLAIIECETYRLVGVLHEGSPNAAIGVVIVVGGPQYRVGSHRQFVLMARHFAHAGIPVLRFDARGMGDSEGEFPSFEALDADIHAAIDCLMQFLPGLSRVVLLGLCDAASANLIYGSSDRRVRGLILMNPWVRTEHGEAKAYLRHYYLQRFMQKSFWRKVFSGKFALTRSIRELGLSIIAARGAGSGLAVPFVDRMITGWERFPHPVLIAISGRDLTASEFVDLCRSDDHCRNLTARLQCALVEFPDADHTMSDESSLRSLSDRCLEWIRDLG